MIYSFLFVAFCADAGIVLFCATLVAEHVIALSLMRYSVFAKSAPWWWGLSGLWLYLTVSGLVLLGGLWLVYPGARSYLLTGTIPFEVMHWSRAIVAAFSALTFAQFACTRLMIELLGSLEARQTLLLDRAPE